MFRGNIQIVKKNDRYLHIAVFHILDIRDNKKRNKIMISEENYYLKIGNDSTNASKKKASGQYKVNQHQCYLCHKKLEGHAWQTHRGPIYCLGCLIKHLECVMKKQRSAYIQTYIQAHMQK